MEARPFGSPLDLDTEFIPTCLNYIVLYKNEEDVVPRVIPYESDDATFESLASNTTLNNSKISVSRVGASDMILPENSIIKKGSIKQIAGEEIDLRSSIKTYRVKTGKKNINGCEFILGSSNRFNNELIQNNSKEEVSPEKHEICLVMPNFERFVHLTVQLNSKINILNCIVDAINKNAECKQKLGLNDFSLMEMQVGIDSTSSTVSFLYKPRKIIDNIEQQLLNNEGLSIFSVFVYNNRISDRFSVQQSIVRNRSPHKLNIVSSLKSEYGLKNNLQQKEIVQVQKRLIKLILQDDKSYLLDFDKIRNIQVRFLLLILKVKQPYRKGLKVFNVIYPPKQTLFEVSDCFQKCDYIHHLTAVVIDESFIFLKQIQKEQLLSFNDLNVISSFCKESQEQAPINPRFIRNTALIAKSKLTTLTTLKIFMSEEQCKDKRKSMLQYIHHIINRHISVFYRESYQFYQSWKNRFINSLCTQILERPIHQGKVYRRVYYKLDRKEGDILQFKGFIVAAINHKQLKDTQTGSTFFIINSKTGRKVGNQTNFTVDNQVIFMPYSRFQIISIRQSHAKQIQIELQELNIEEPTTKSSFILWVDDKVGEGKTLFSCLLKTNEQILMYQFLSTFHLNQWIEKNKKLIKINKSIQFIIISNMRRKQNQREVTDAGVDTLEVARAKIPNMKFIFYIGYIEGTKKALANRKVSHVGVHIINDFTPLLQTLEAFISSREEEHSDDNFSVIYEMPQKQNWNELFSQLN